MPTRSNPFGALCTAMVTPFDAHLEVDQVTLLSLADHLIATGTQTLVVTGTTGESPTLSDTEKLEIYALLKKHVGQRAKIIAGTGSYDTRATILLSQAAQEVGVDGLLVVNPYYNKPSQEGLFQHFSAIAQAVELPIILYNHPGRTGVCLTVETIQRLVEKHPHIAGVKDSSGDLVLLSEMRRVLPDSFLIFSGDDPLTLPILSLDGDGVISVASHVAGPALKQMMDAFWQGDLATAQRLHFQLLPLMRGLFCAPSPAPTKAALAIQGVPVGGVRLPMVPLTSEQHSLVEKLLQELTAQLHE